MVSLMWVDASFFCSVYILVYPVKHLFMISYFPHCDTHLHNVYKMAKVEKLIEIFGNGNPQ